LEHFGDQSIEALKTNQLKLETTSGKKPVQKVSVEFHRPLRLTV